MILQMPVKELITSFRPSQCQARNKQTIHRYRSLRTAHLPMHFVGLGLRYVHTDYTMRTARIRRGLNRDLVWYQKHSGTHVETFLDVSRYFFEFQ